MEEKAHCVQMQYHTLILEYRKASKEFDNLVDMIDGGLTVQCQPYCIRRGEVGGKKLIKSRGKNEDAVAVKKSVA